MSLKGIFEGIQEIAETTLFAPFNAMKELELSNWWTANTINWLFLAILCVALLYWMKQLNIFNTNNEENRDPKAHGFLGKESELEHRL